MKTLECEGAIYLRPITVEDTDNILRWRNSDGVKKYFIYQDDITREEHLSWLEKQVKSGKAIQFIIVEKETERPVGSVYLRDVDRVHNKAEYGIFIGEEDAKGKGYGTVAAKRMISYAFEKEKIHRIYLRVYEDNLRAVSSYEKAGFRREGQLIDDVYVNGKYHNIVWMAIVNSN